MKRDLRTVLLEIRQLIEEADAEILRRSRLDVATAADDYMFMQGQRTAYSRVLEWVVAETPGDEITEEEQTLGDQTNVRTRTREGSTRRIVLPGGRPGGTA